MYILKDNKTLNFIIKIIIIISVVSAIRRGSQSVSLISPHFRLSYFVEQSSFLRLKAVLVRLEISRGNSTVMI